MSSQSKSLLQATAFHALSCGGLLLSPPWLLTLLQILLWILVLLILFAAVFHGSQIQKDFEKTLVRDWLDGDNYAITGPSLSRVVWRWGCSLALALSMAFVGMPWLATAWLLSALALNGIRQRALAQVQQMDLNVQRALDAYREATDHPV